MDHTNSSQHQASMMYLKADLAKANKEPVTSFSPITRSLTSDGHCYEGKNEA